MKPADIDITVGIEHALIASNDLLVTGVKDIEHDGSSETGCGVSVSADNALSALICIKRRWRAYQLR
ncbi:hypothetical protein D3C75_1125850 [compost metagenome]